MRLSPAFGSFSCPAPVPRGRPQPRWRMSGCVSQSALLFYAPDDGFARSFPHPRLPMDALATAFLARRTVDWLPVSSQLFDLLSRGGGNARGAAGKLAWAEATCALSALGRAGGGSGAGAGSPARLCL